MTRVERTKDWEQHLAIHKAKRLPNLNCRKRARQEHSDNRASTFQSMDQLLIPGSRFHSRDIFRQQSGAGTGSHSKGKCAL